MNIVKVRNINIGEGMPKICVPIVGITKEDIIQEAKSAADISMDIVEWRADWFEGVLNFQQVQEVLKELRTVLADTPILFTFRTSKEGGKKEITPESYADLNKKVATTGLIDLIDVEVFMGDEIVKELIQIAHEQGVKVIASNHDFEKTPEKEDIVRRLRKMQALGADIPKIAVMPLSKNDVLTLLSATLEMVENYADRPIITMSMAADGAISRIVGEVFGSALTFGAVKKCSAPGQMEVQELKQTLEIIHKNC